MIKMEADVVVIAAGASGITAAVAAAEKDAGVIVFEKGSTTGGAASMGMGPLAIGTKQAKAQMIDFTVDDAFEFFMNYNHWSTDAKLVKKWLGITANTIEWLEGMGVEFLGVYKYFENSNQTWHIVKMPGSNKPAERSAGVIFKTLTQRAEELGVEIHFQTPVYKILTDNGKVTGVMARNAQGEDILAECSCVIIATGGFGDNPQMIKEELGFEWGRDLFSFRIPGVNGDGIKMAREIGAAKTKITMELTYTTPGITDVFKTISETMRQPNLLVNLEGKRLFNEERMNNTVYTGNTISAQTKRCGFSIISDNILDYYKKNGLDYVTIHHNIKTIEKWESEVESYLKGETKTDVAFASLQSEATQSVKSFFVADSIEDLAAQAGIDAKALKQTIKEYNECAGRYDKQFNKHPKYMLPIEGPRYYAAIHYPAGYGSLGGIRVNENLQVVKEDGKVIHGLYSCGTDACAIFGDSYNFLMPGSTMSFAINSGRMAGMNAVDYIDSDDFVE
jgi:fumarate reductase flavoprotein subunit